MTSINASHNDVPSTGFISRIYGIYMTVLWMMGFSQFPQEVYSTRPMLTAAATVFGAVQAAANIISQLYFMLFDSAPLTTETSFNDLIEYASQILYSFVMIYACLIGWKTVRPSYQLVKTIDTQFIHHIPARVQRSALIVLGVALVVNISGTVLDIVLSDVPLYQSAGTASCRSKICFVLIAVYYAYWRVCFFSKMFLQILLWFTMIMLTRLARVVSVEADAFNGTSPDFVGLSIKRYEHIRQQTMQFGKQFSVFNFLYTLHYFVLLLTNSYSLGKDYAVTQTIDWSNFYFFTRSAFVLATIATVFVTSHENMTAVLPVISRLIFKYGKSFRSANFQQLADKVKNDPVGFSMGGVTITFDLCFEAAGIIFANVVLFAELGHENHLLTGSLKALRQLSGTSRPVPW
ncbi:uncharacterized protein LOC129582562 [Paramacrobiotus metropolitanus]|uniref:uncharacterized protein LOC129582562 n=1 Tax=Paramacrobiotus metropolitanus TaxID=2943436 RepID=UPI002446404B|nr:uncharacterized protein LOC129582562 [Paramacrobiotus metropolitanus]